MLAGALLSALALSGGCALTEARDVSLRDYNIRVRDLVSSDCGAASNPNVRDAVVASVPSGRKSVVLGQAALARLVHRRVPGIVLGSNDDAARVTFHVPAARVAIDAAPCFATATTIAAGDAINGSDLTSVPCGNNAAAPIAYDRTYGLTRAGADIGAGGYLGHLNVPPERLPDTGDRLTIVATEGATRIERPVTAAQPASRASELFVRDAEGHVFAAPLAATAQRPRAP
jgi:hypothetical protein